ncbi:hypothetical protein FHR75_000352 [Kineococcus radiotolerans]|uniref:Carbohydrate-binding module family 96 domain-containing protein n=1 Tax=Kineococcus radiotolerans TaxID=131568 RepID=A0A7W4TIJ6_KINRA|nr:endo-1,3-alpha-glucanase family glycosylhydrolase [Kineococcus radiotolerans]MBB2899564.1 hypothetical protein [Kineococcus radiotolerans]
MRLSPQLRTGTTRTRRWLTALLGATAVSTATLVPVLTATTANAAERPGASAFTTNDVLPFDMPSASASKAQGKLVFAHYMPSLPVSLDNADPANDYYARNYLKPGGEGGKHAAYGGFLRDRPLPVAKQAGSDWKLKNFELEVRQAKSAGIDGFSVDLLSVNPGSPLYQNQKLLLQAAQNVGGFSILLVPDMTAGASSSTPQSLAATVADLAGSSAAHRLADGRLVVSPFHADSRNASWWGTFLSVMKSEHRMPVAFFPLSLDERTSLSSFKSIAYGISNWGNRNPAWNSPAPSSSPMTRAKNVQSLGLQWMQPVSVQDERPTQGIYDEAENTQNLRNTWAIARDSGANWVQIPTWNDYVEGSHIGPSAGQGWSFLDINAYYTAWYKTGSAPTIERDTVYVTHRTQSVSAKQTTPQTKTMRHRGGSAPRDTVEALTFLTAPGTVTVTVGSTKHTCQVDAGVDTCVVPLGTGTVSAAVTRGSSTVAAVTSPQVVTNSPSVQDLHYVAASSRREGSSIPVSAPAPVPTVPASPRPTVPVTPAPVTSTPAPSTPAPSTPAPVGQPAGSTSTALFPMNDTYANEGAPSGEYGSDPLLVSRTGPGARAYLRFALPSAPAGKVLTGATLRVRTASDPMAASSVAHRVRLASNVWKEASLNWNNRPGASGAILGEVAAGAKVNSSYDVALATAPISSVLGTNQTVAIDALGADSLWLWSSENADRNLRPQLVLTWS